MFKQNRYLPKFDTPDDEGGDINNESSRKTFTDLLSEGTGDAIRLAERLFNDLEQERRDAYRHREKKREAQDQLNLYSELGTVDELSRLKKQHEENEKELARLRSESQALKRDQVIRRAAGIADYDEDVLRDQLGDLDLAIEDDKAYVLVKKGDSEERVELTEYAEEHFKKYINVLKKKGAQEETTRKTAPWLVQGSGKKASDETPASSYLKSKYKKAQST